MDDNMCRIIGQEREFQMEKSVSVQGFTRSLPTIYLYDHVVRLKSGASYRVSRCHSHREVYQYMRSLGYDPKDIVSVTSVTPK